MPVDLVIFQGGIGGSFAEDVVANTQKAITLDTIYKSLHLSLFRRIILVTDSFALPDDLCQKVIIKKSDKEFHFGKQLLQLIKEFDIYKLFYIGGGSSPLLSSENIKSMVDMVERQDKLVISNNTFSADFFAFSPARCLENIKLPAIDNGLPRLLIEQAGFKEICLDRNAETQFDVDTPTDVLILSLYPQIGSTTYNYIKSLDLSTETLRNALAHFKDKNSEIVLAGRIGSFVWTQMEKRTSCRVRVLSEERGMRSDGREENNTANSILGYYLQNAGIEKFFDIMPKLGTALFLDSRVIFQHFKLNPSRKDRFLSDLGMWQEIDDSFIKDFTRCAAEARIPVVLGGHSLLSGGLLALLDIMDNSNKPCTQLK